MKKFLSFLLSLLICLNLFVVTAYADDLSIKINVYQNEECIGSKNIDAMCGETIDISSFNQLYGEPTKATVTIDGNEGIVFAWGLPDSIIYTDKNYGTPEPGAKVVINLYYVVAVEPEPEPEPEPITYGSITLTLYGAESTPVVFTGVKGVDTQTITKELTSAAALQFEVDDSYSWSYTVNGTTYVISSFPHHNDISLATEEPEPIVQDEVISVLYQFSAEPGGTMENEIALDAFVTFGPFEIKPEDAEYNEHLASCGVTQDGSNLVYNGDSYRLGAVYTTAEVTSRHYTLIKPIYTVLVNYLDTDGNVIFAQTHQEMIGSTNLLGKQTYSYEALEIKGYTFDHNTGDPLEGELDGDKTINLIYTKEVEVTPTPTPKPTSKPKPTPTPKPIVIIVTPQPTNTPTPTPTIEPTATPEVTPQIIYATPEAMDDDPVPLTRFNEPEEVTDGGHWALVNLVLMICSALGMLKLEEKKKYNIFNVMFAVAPIIVFVFTENTFLPMVFVDKYTLFMLFLFIGEGLSHIFMKNKEESNLEKTENL